MTLIRTLSLTLALAFLALASAQQATEGRFVLYAAHGSEIVEPMLELFEEHYPDITVDAIFGAGTGELMNRIQSESGNPQGDMMWGGATELYEANANVFAPVELPNDAAVVAQHEDHIWHATDLLFQTIVVNTTRLDEDQYPSTFEELADPMWGELGGIALANPRTSGTGYSLVTTMVTLYGWDYLTDVLRNATVTEGSGAMFQMGQTGEVPVSFINEDLGAKWMSEGVPIVMIYPEDGVSNQIGAAGLIAGGPNPEPATTFLNFLMNVEAQELLSEVVQRRPARTDVAPPEGLAPIGDLDLVRPDADWVANETAEILNDFDEAWDEAR